MENVLNKKHTNYPSRYTIGEEVVLNFGTNGSIEGCEIDKLHFTESKVSYDIIVPVRAVHSKELPNTTTIIKNVDSLYVKDKIIENGTTTNTNTDTFKISNHFEQSELIRENEEQFQKRMRRKTKDELIEKGIIADDKEEREKEAAKEDLMAFKEEKETKNPYQLNCPEKPDKPTGPFSFAKDDNGHLIFNGTTYYTKRQMIEIVQEWTCKEFASADDMISIQDSFKEHLNSK